MGQGLGGGGACPLKERCPAKLTVAFLSRPWHCVRDGAKKQWLAGDVDLCPFESGAWSHQ